MNIVKDIIALLSLVVAVYGIYIIGVLCHG